MLSATMGGMIVTKLEKAKREGVVTGAITDKEADALLHDIITVVAVMSGKDVPFAKTFAMEMLNMLGVTYE